MNSLAHFKARIEADIAQHSGLIGKQIETLGHSHDVYLAHSVAEKLALATAKTHTLRHLEHLWAREGIDPADTDYVDVNMTRAWLMTYLLSAVPTDVGDVGKHLRLVAVKAVAEQFQLLFPAQIVDPWEAEWPEADQATIS